MLPRKGQEFSNKLCVQGRIPQPFTPKAVNEILIDGRQATNNLPRRAFVLEVSVGGLRLNWLYALLIPSDASRINGTNSSSSSPDPGCAFPKRPRNARHNAIDNVQMNRVSMLQQERRATVHAPASEIESKVQGRMVSLRGNGGWLHTMEVSVAVLPRPIAMMWVVGYFLVEGANLLADHCIRRRPFRFTDRHLASARRDKRGATLVTTLAKRRVRLRLVG